MYLIYDPHCEDWKFTSPTHSSSWNITLSELTIAPLLTPERHERTIKEYHDAVFYALDNFDDLATTYPELLI
jgi:hypothetical protein